MVTAGLRDVAGVIGVAVAALLTLYALAVCTPGGQILENAVVLGSDAAHSDPTWAQPLLATIADDRALLVGLAVPLILGWWRGRVMVGIVVAATVLAANLTTQVLKLAIFVRPELVADPGVGGGNSLPSGTVTFLLSVALGIAVLLPDSTAMRRVGHLLTVGAIGGGCATIALDWHRPADVLAGTIVAVAWFAIARSVLDRLGPWSGAARRDRDIANARGHSSDARPSTTTHDWRPLTRGLVLMTVVVGIPLGAVAAMPGLALDPTAHGPLAYVVALVLTATASLLVTAGFASSCHSHGAAVAGGSPREATPGSDTRPHARVPLTLVR